MTKPTKWLCVQRWLRAAWASAQSGQSSLCTQWVAKDPSFLHADSKDSGQTGRMPSLVAHAILLSLSWGGSNVVTDPYHEMLFFYCLNFPDILLCYLEVTADDNVVEGDKMTVPDMPVCNTVLTSPSGSVDVTGKLAPGVPCEQTIAMPLDSLVSVEFRNLDSVDCDSGKWFQLAANISPNLRFTNVFKVTVLSYRIWP